MITIRTLKELKALPVGSVIRECRSDDPRTAIRRSDAHGRGAWSVSGEFSHQSSFVTAALLPAVLLLPVEPELEVDVACHDVGLDGIGMPGPLVFHNELVLILGQLVQIDEQFHVLADWVESAPDVAWEGFSAKDVLTSAWMNLRASEQWLTSLHNLYGTDGQEVSI